MATKCAEVPCGTFSRAEGQWSWYAGDVVITDPLARMHTTIAKKSKAGRLDVKALLSDNPEFWRTLMRTALQEALEAEMMEALSAETRYDRIREAGRPTQ